MPLYEYRCTKCGYRFEKIQHFSEEPLTECPKCHGELMRPLTAPAFKFKGSGWYVNDYASHPSSVSSESSSSPSTESKPAESTASSGNASDSGAGSSTGSQAAKPAASSSAT